MRRPAAWFCLLQNDFRSVAGVDISSDYIAETKRIACKKLGNVEFAESLSAFRAAGAALTSSTAASCSITFPGAWAKNNPRDVQLLKPAA